MTILSEAIAAVQATSNCVTLGPRRPIVAVDGLRHGLHRAVYIQVCGPLEREEFLLQGCSTAGCFQPLHFEVSPTPYRPRAECPNGHPYRDSDVREGGPRVCGRCKAQRRRGGDPHWVSQLAKKWCPQGHPYSKENTYLEKTPTGYRRHCRTCIANRSAKRYAARSSRA